MLAPSGFIFVSCFLLLLYWMFKLELMLCCVMNVGD